MPTREEIMTFVRQLFDRWIRTADDSWIALYRLLLDYIHGVPRITDSNRLKRGIWRERAEQVEKVLTTNIQCKNRELEKHVDVFIRKLYQPGIQRMNPIGIAFACAVVYLIQRFSTGKYEWKLEAKIGTEVFPNLTGFRRKSVDIVALHHGVPFAIISSKWGMRHDRIRDPQEEADTYKRELPSLKFFIVTNEFDSARLQKVLTYPSIDGVFHVRRDLVWQAYGGMTDELSNLKELTELFVLFP
jgi:hypothetical protein